MNRINRQKFLAELGRLLTFMYEEDRQTALAMYNRMFDEAESEQALLQYLVSPTRQAVILARAYNAKERKLQVHTQSRDEYEQSTDEIPDFVLAINKLQDEASALKITTPQVSEDQISLFDDSNAVTETESAPAPAAQENIEPAADEKKAETQDETEEAPAQKEIPPMFADEPAEEAEPDETNDSVTRLADAVDAFLADFTISNDELIAKAKPAAEEEEKAAEPEEEKPAAADEPAEVPAEETVTEQPEEADVHEPVQAEPEETETETAAVGIVETEEEDEDAETVRKPIVPLLILYIIFAIPLGLIGILLLLIPAFVSLSLAITAGFLGINGFAATFTGFAVLADILVVAGVSLILLALALLFLWLFVWFIGGAIVGLIHGLCVLGGKWCYKEVAVQ